MVDTNSSLFVWILVWTIKLYRQEIGFVFCFFKLKSCKLVSLNYIYLYGGLLLWVIVVYVKRK